MFKKYFFLLILVAFLGVLIVPSQVFAATSISEEIAAAVDTVWVLVAAFLVFIMQAGFAMVETGFTRAKNAGNIIMKNFIDLCCGSISYWLIGFTLMFGLSQGGFTGWGALAFSGDYTYLGLTIPPYAFLIFQTVFAATAATIVSGAVAERIKFSVYLIYSIVITAFIYPVVGHWVWGGGWLYELGFIDFAGSTVVHSVGAWAGLMGAYYLGPRLGKYTVAGKAKAIPGHSITLGALGVFLLWFGWFGFNGGSTLSGMDTSIGLIIVNTNLAAAAGGLLSMATSWLKYKKPDVSLTLNGGLAGLVGVTAGAAAVTPLGAVIIGICSGILVVIAVEVLDKKLKIDDPVGAISVHGICGALGTVLVGFLATEGGLFYGGGTSLILVQLTGVAAVALWTIVTAGILFATLKATIGLRVPEKEEIRGLDYNEHGLDAYADFVPR